MRASRLGAAALGLAVGLGPVGPLARADEHSAWRLFVGDHQEPVVQALDAHNGAVLARFETESPTRLQASASGGTVFALQRDSGVVAAFASGLHFDDHGDHADMQVSEPVLLKGRLTGGKPVHFVEHYGEIAVFFDDEGVARIVTEKAMQADGPETRLVSTPAPHHGVVIPYGSHTLVTVPHPDDPSQLPIGIAVVDRQGKPVGEVAACPGLHGEAASGSMVAIACDTGLLIVTGGREKAPQIRHLAYGDGLPKDAKVSTLAGGVALQYFLGNFGADAVVLIDPEDDRAFRLVQLPTRRVHFVTDPIRPKYAYVFTEDGKLHRINVLAGKIDRSLALTEPYSMDGHWSDPRPRVAVAGDRVFVTDPLRSRIHAVEADSFNASTTFAVTGKPYEIVAVGGSGETHENH